MMKVLESFLAKLYITLIPSGKGMLVSAVLRKDESIKKHFAPLYVEGSEALTAEIKRLSRESALHYVILLESEAKQDILRNCHVAATEAKHENDVVCIEKRWAISMDKDALFQRQKEFLTIGLDLLFSPFSLLREVFKESIAQNDGLYLFIIDGALFGIVFKEGTALFGQHELLEIKENLLDTTPTDEVYVEAVQRIVKAFYDTKIDETMFIEKVYIADTLHFDATLENRLEELLFVEVHKVSVELNTLLVDVAQKRSVAESFITSRVKKMFGSEVKWLFSIFVLLLVLMLGGNLLLNSAIKTEHDALVEVTKRTEVLAIKSEAVTSETARLRALEKFRESINTKNRIKKENVQNFFDLVPDGVVLELAEFRGGTLRLKGTTKSKKHFLNTFQRSLDSLFPRSSTTFVKRKDGLYHFRNISIMEQKK